MVDRIYNNVDFPQPDYPTRALLLELNSKFILLRILRSLSLGYANVTPSNLIIPLKTSGFFPFSGFFIKGSLSIILKILEAACLP